MGRRITGKKGFSKSGLTTGSKTGDEKGENLSKISKTELRTSGTDTSLGKNPKTQKSQTILNNPIASSNNPKSKKKTRFRKRKISVGFISNVKKKTVDNGFIVKRGKDPWDWQITVTQDLVKPRLKSFKGVDHRKVDKLIITEKAEVAKILESLNLKNTTIHNIGGNPFSAPKRSDVADNVDKVRREERSIEWKFKGTKFPYPLTSAKTDVLIIADDDPLGFYLSQNIAHSIKSKNVRIVNSETNQVDTLEDIVFNRIDGDRYDHKDNNYIGASWFVGSQAEIGGTFTSALQNKETLFDTFTKDMRGDTPWQARKKTKDQPKEIGFRAIFLRPFFSNPLRANFNPTDQELAVLGEVLRNEKENKIRIKATVQTDLGLKQVVGESNIDFQDFNSKIFDVRIVEKDRKVLNVKNTDDTVLILADKLGINTRQGELILQRLSSDGLLTYPRTEFEGISQKEDISSTKLADIWLSYMPEFKEERRDIIEGIDRIKNESGEFPRSGILVIKPTTFKPNTLEKKILNEIANANILASLGALEVTGEIQIINKETDEPIEMIDQSEVSIITRKEESVGKVILVETERKEGLTDRELFRFMSKERKPDDKDSTLGTVSSRNTLVAKLKAWQLILENPQGELKTDDKAKLMVLLFDKAIERNKKAHQKNKNIKLIPSVTTGEFTKFTRDQRDDVSNNPDLYLERKELLYSHLGEISKTLWDKKAHQEVELEFNELSKQIDLSRKIKADLRDDSVQIVEADI